jgi:hypothetical protein
LSVDDRLRAISELREELRVAKPKALARARELAAQELNKLEALLDTACHIAHEEGASYAAIGRALGTKDFGTIKRRTGSTTSVAADSEFEYKNDLFYYRGRVVDFMQYQDTGTVEFFTALDGQEDRATAFLKSKGAIT